MANDPVAIASDHAGFEQKRQLVAWLSELGFEVHDLGPATDERVDYPDYAAKVAGEVATGTAARGILVCGTGIGMAIAANKRRNVRAANITSPQFAILAREHNDANVIALSGRFVDLDTNKQIVNNFLTTDFGGGRHADRVKKIRRLEAAIAANRDATINDAATTEAAAWNFAGGMMLGSALDWPFRNH